MEVEIMVFAISVPVPIPMGRLQCRGLQIAILRFLNNLKSKPLNKNTIMTPFLNSFELNAAEEIWIKENQKSFNEKKLKALRNDLN